MNTEKILNGIGIEIQDFSYREESATTLIQAVVQVQVAEVITETEDAYNKLATYFGVCTHSEQLNSNLVYKLEATDWLGTQLYSHIARDFKTLSDTLLGLREDLEKSPDKWFIQEYVGEDGEPMPTTDSLTYAKMSGDSVDVTSSISLKVEPINLLTHPLSMKGSFYEKSTDAKAQL